MSHHLLHKSGFFRHLLLAAALLALAAGPARANLGDELFKLTAADAAAMDQFGNTVAISGHTALVGAHGNDDDGEASGSAYLFDVTTGGQLRKLTASDTSEFGRSVAIFGDKALVGSPGYGAESAYLFDVTTGNELFKLRGSDTRLADGFGYSVGLSGNTAIIGAAFTQSTVAAGAAYLFDPTTGQELRKLTASDAAERDTFGWSVAISGNTAIVGAPGEGTQPGAAYLFDVTTGQELFKLAASDPGTGNLAGNLFGHSVAISGNIAIVAALRGLDGSAYVFDVTTGKELFKLTDPDPTVFDQFGQSVAINGDFALVGTIMENDVCPSDPLCRSGAAWLFDVHTGQRLMKVTASDAAAGDLLGWSVALDGDTALVGANGKNQYNGSAYVLSAVPEPSSLALLLVGVAGWGVVRRVNRSRSQTR